MEIKELFRKYLNNEASDLEKQAVEEWVAVLFEKLRSGAASSEETALVQEWLEQFNINGQVAESLAEKMRVDKEEVWSIIRKQVQPPAGANDPLKRRRNIVFLKYAAALVIIFIITALVYNTHRHKETAGVHKTIAPGDSIIHLTCNIGESAKLFTLPDSTHIYLNSNSSITYHAGSYNNAERTVTLEKGSAFFDVTKNTARPFTVQSGDLTVTVTGTSFEVCASTAINKTAVSVKNGSVAVSRNAQPLAALHAGQALAFNPDHTFKVIPASGTIAGWTSGKVIFSDAGIDEIKNIMENRFGKNLVNKSNKLNNAIKFNASFGRDATIAEIAESISSLYNVHYSIEKDSLVFY